MEGEMSHNCKVNKKFVMVTLDTEYEDQKYKIQAGMVYFKLAGEAFRIKGKFYVV